MPVRLEDTIVQSPACLSSDVGDDVVVMSIERGLYLALDPIGRDIWGRLATPCTVKDLCGTLLTDYDAPREVIETDVLALIDTLADAGVVDVHP